MQGKVGVVTLAAGVGSRWTEGAGVCKALHPFNRFSGRHRSFIEVHLAKNRKTSNDCNGSIPHVFTTSYLTDDAIRTHLIDAPKSRTQKSSLRFCWPQHRDADDPHDSGSSFSLGRNSPTDSG